jgi:hypothetical protein
MQELGRSGSAMSNPMLQPVCKKDFVRAGAAWLHGLLIQVGKFVHLPNYDIEIKVRECSDRDHHRYSSDLEIIIKLAEGTLGKATSQKKH